MKKVKSDPYNLFLHIRQLTYFHIDTLYKDENFKLLMSKNSRLTNNILSINPHLNLKDIYAVSFSYIITLLYIIMQENPLKEIKQLIIKEMAYKCIYEDCEYDGKDEQDVLTLANTFEDDSDDETFYDDDIMGCPIAQTGYDSDYDNQMQNEDDDDASDTEPLTGGYDSDGE